MDNNKVSIWQPSKGLSDNIFRNFFDGMPLNFMSPTTAIEMYEDDDNVTVKFSAPGYEKENFEISIEDDVLTISANIESETEEENKKKKYYYREMKKQSFSRSISLPVRVVGDKANAEYKNGVLAVTLPKAEEVKPKKIDIKAE